MEKLDVLNDTLVTEGNALVNQISDAATDMLADGLDEVTKTLLSKHSGEPGVMQVLDACASHLHQHLTGGLDAFRNHVMQHIFSVPPELQDVQAAQALTGSSAAGMNLRDYQAEVARITDECDKTQVDNARLEATLHFLQAQTGADVPEAVRELEQAYQSKGRDLRALLGSEADFKVMEATAERARLLLDSKRQAADAAPL